MLCCTNSFLATITLLVFPTFVVANLNVYGNALEPCSTSGMALTGWTRSGSCVDEDDDAGSHHVCIDIPT